MGRARAGLRSMTGFGTARAASLGTRHGRGADGPTSASSTSASPRRASTARGGHLSRARARAGRTRASRRAGRAHRPAERPRPGGARPRGRRDWAAAWRKLKQALRLAGELELGLFRATDVFQSVQLPGDVRAGVPRRRTRARAGARAPRRRTPPRRGESPARHAPARRAAGRDRAHPATHTAAALSEVQVRLTERVQRLLRGHEVDAGRIAQEAALLASAATSPRSASGSPAISRRCGH